MGEVFTDYHLTEVDMPTIQDRLRVAKEFEIRGASGRTMATFRMRQRNMLSSRCEAEVTDKDGVRYGLPISEVSTYEGTARIDDDLYRARISVREDGLEGVIFTGDDWTYIEPLGEYNSKARRGQTVVYRQSQIRQGQEWRCGVPHRLKRGRETYAVKGLIDKETVYKVEIATDADTSTRVTMAGRRSPTVRFAIF